MYEMGAVSPSIESCHLSTYYLIHSLDYEPLTAKFCFLLSLETFARRYGREVEPPTAQHHSGGSPKKTSCQLEIRGRPADGRSQIRDVERYPCCVDGGSTQSTC